MPSTRNSTSHTVRANPPPALPGLVVRDAAGNATGKSAGKDTSSSMCWQHPFSVGKDAGSADVGRRWPSGDRHVPGQHNKTVHNVNVTGKRNCNCNEEGKTMHTTTMTGLHEKL